MVKGLAALRPRSYKLPPTPFCPIFWRILMRPSRRAPDELRAVSLERGVVKYAEGSCLVKFGDTHVLVTATLEERLPPWLKGQGRGWVTAEYGIDRKSTRLNSSHVEISYAVFCLKKKKKTA